MFSSKICCTASQLAQGRVRQRRRQLWSSSCPLGTFATWQAERAVGDHDRNTLRLRLDLHGESTGFEPGMSVWLDR